MTVPLPKEDIVATVEDEVSALKSLQASRGWAILVKILNENIKYLETAILEKIDPGTKVILSDDEIEILRTKRGLNIELRDTPANYTKVIRDQGEIPENYDPYFKTAAEIKKAEAIENIDDH